MRSGKEKVTASQKRHTDGNQLIKRVILRDAASQTDLVSRTEERPPKEPIKTPDGVWVSGNQLLRDSEPYLAGQGSIQEPTRTSARSEREDRPALVPGQVICGAGADPGMGYDKYGGDPQRYTLERGRLVVDGHRCQSTTGFPLYQSSRQANQISCVHHDQAGDLRGCMHNPTLPPPYQANNAVLNWTSRDPCMHRTFSEAGKPHVIREEAPVETLEEYIRRIEGEASVGHHWVAEPWDEASPEAYLLDSVATRPLGPADFSNHGDADRAAWTPGMRWSHPDADLLTSAPVGELNLFPEEAGVAYEDPAETYLGEAQEEYLAGPWQQGDMF